MKNILSPLDESVLVSWAASATDAAIQREDFGPGTTILIFSKENVNDSTKIIIYGTIFISLADSGLLMKGVAWTVENERKESKRLIRCQFIRKTY